MSLFANESLSQGIPVWRCLFNASFPNTQLGPDMRAYHGSEIPIVFGTYPGGPVNPLTAAPIGRIRSNVPPTTEEIAMSHATQTAWANFAKCPHCGPGWNSAPSVMDFELEECKHSMGHVIDPWEIDHKCHLYTDYYLAINGPLPGL